MMTTTSMDHVAVDAREREDSLCPRCGGLMVPDRYIDLLDDTGHLEFTAARCVSCGEVMDPVIIENRHRGVPLPRRGAKRERPSNAMARPAPDAAGMPEVEPAPVPAEPTLG
jgi:hypothetical protein